MPNNYGAASGIMGLFKKGYDEGSKILGRIPTFGAQDDRQPDTSWHDQMVQRANQSFAQAQQKQQPKKGGWIQSQTMKQRGQ